MIPFSTACRGRIIPTASHYGHHPDEESAANDAIELGWFQAPVRLLSAGSRGCSPRTNARRVHEYARPCFFRFQFRLESLRQVQRAQCRPETTMGTAANKSGKRRKTRWSSSVPGSYRGFSYQGTRFLVHLLKSRAGSSVCLEVFEDVGVELPSGTRVAEQNKSYLSRNPLATRAPSLWGSLRNWVEEVAAGRLDPSATVFVLCAPGASPCDIAKKFHAATSPKDVKEAILFADEVLAASVTADGSVKADIEFVFGNRDAFPKVVSRLSIENPSVDADEVNPTGAIRVMRETPQTLVRQWQPALAHDALLSLLANCFA